VSCSPDPYTTGAYHPLGRVIDVWPTCPGYDCRYADATGAKNAYGYSVTGYDEAAGVILKDAPCASDPCAWRPTTTPADYFDPGLGVIAGLYGSTKNLAACPYHVNVPTGSVGMRVCSRCTETFKRYGYLPAAVGDSFDCGTLVDQLSDDYCRELCPGGFGEKFDADSLRAQVWLAFAACALSSVHLFAHALDTLQCRSDPESPTSSTSWWPRSKST